MNANKKLGMRIAEIRRKKGISQEAFADRCGFSRSYMSNVERGNVSLKLSTISIFATSLNIPLDELISTEDPHFFVQKNRDQTSIKN